MGGRDGVEEGFTLVPLDGRSAELRELEGDDMFRES